MKLITLLEDRTEFAANQYSAKLMTAASNDHIASKLQSPLEITKFIEKNIDPTKSKHVLWLTKMYAANQYKFEDANRIKKELEQFEKFKSKISNKDLASYKSFDDLYDVLEPFADAAPLVSNKQKIANVKKDAEVFFEKSGFKAIIPKTQEASCLYGSGTKWCTAADSDNMFDQYHKQGDLIIILVKLNGKDRKFQFHYETESFMNERDQPINQTDINALSKLPEYTEFMNLLIKKHYVKHL